ncbi:MAG: hypothetical protein PVG66_02170 [Chromatiales bacterium]|jgi:hypothetical protein
MIKYAFIASFLGSIAGSLVMIILSTVSYGSIGVIFGLVMLPVAFISSFILSIPLMKLRKYIDEPYFLALYIVIGCIGGVLAVNITFQKSIYEYWFILIYGSLGVVCAVIAWLYLIKNLEKWHNVT